MTIIAINKTHQTALNRAYRAYRKYHLLVNQEDSFDPCSKDMDRLTAKQEKAFDAYIEIYEELPKREQMTFNQQHKNLHGYT